MDSTLVHLNPQAQTNSELMSKARNNSQGFQNHTIYPIRGLLNLALEHKVREHLGDGFYVGIVQRSGHQLPKLRMRVRFPLLTPRVKCHT